MGADGLRRRHGRHGLRRRHGRHGLRWRHGRHGLRRRHGRHGLRWRHGRDGLRRRHGRHGLRASARRAQAAASAQRVERTWLTVGAGGAGGAAETSTQNACSHFATLSGAADRCLRHSEFLPTMGTVYVNFHHPWPSPVKAPHATHPPGYNSSLLNCSALVLRD